MNKNISFICFLTAVLLSTCQYTPGTTTRSSMVTPDGRTRTFNIYVPIDYAGLSPLLFVFHGGGGTGAGAERHYNVNQVADQNNIVVIYPDGVNRTWNAGDCCGYAEAEDIDDITFTILLIKEANSVLSIDPSRIYASGMSNGAVFSYRLACEKSDIFAAVGIVEGCVEFFPCDPTYPIAIYQVYGTEDVNIPLYGGLACDNSGNNWTGVAYSLDLWAGLNGCECSYSNNLTTDCAVVTMVENDGICSNFGPCSSNPNVDITMCIIEGGGHAWSGQNVPPNHRNHVGDCNYVIGTFNVSSNMWAFFSQYQRFNNSNTILID